MMNGGQMFIFLETKVQKQTFTKKIPKDVELVQFI